MAKDTPKVYRNAEGEIVYDGPPWSELSDDERTARIMDCQKIQHCSRLHLASILQALAPDRKPSQAIIAGHIERHGIVHPKVRRSDAPRATNLRALTTMHYAGQKLGSREHQRQKRVRKAEGDAIIAKVEQESAPPISDMEKLKNQKGFCVALDRRTGDYCGEPADGNLCEKHKKARAIR